MEKGNKKFLRYLVKQYLNRYYKAVQKKRDLERRLKTLTDDAKNPLRGIDYEPLPRSSAGSQSSGAAGFTYALGEIQEKIIEQQGRMNEIVVNVLDIIDVLLEGTCERDIIEYRYVDCMSWRKIASKMNMSEQNCYKYHTKALDILVSSQKVVTIVKNYFEKNKSVE